MQLPDGIPFGQILADARVGSLSATDIGCLRFFLSDVDPHLLCCRVSAKPAITLFRPLCDIESPTHMRCLLERELKELSA